MYRSILLSLFRPFTFMKLTIPCTLPLASAVSHLSAFFSCFTSFGPAAAPRSKGSPRDETSLSLSFSLVLLLSHFPRLPRSSSLFLAGQRLMDIHSNEVKAINNSGGNAYPHLVPFLLKSSVCNKRPSRSREKEKERNAEKERGKEKRRRRV